MKKRNQWVTKKIKRAKKLEDKGIVDLSRCKGISLKSSITELPR